jgi:Mannitol dehydrogenase C-terminal domain
MKRRNWITGNVSYVTTMVDRITPESTTQDIAGAQAATGVRDRAGVVTEPFSEWVISGEFAAGRPRWEDAGATFTTDVSPFEDRKLWMLNGAHDAGPRRLHPGARDRGRRHGGPDVPALARPVVGRLVAAPEPARRQHRRLP